MCTRFYMCWNNTEATLAHLVELGWLENDTSHQVKYYDKYCVIIIVLNSVQVTGVY